MRQMFLSAALLSLIAAMAAVSLTGCSISTSDNKDKGDNVKIATPFGGMQIKTDDAGVLAGIGLPAYPGATLEKKLKDKDGNGDKGAADIDMNFGSFQLKVKAVSYQTTDRPEQVMAFYKKALGRFGNVIECEHKHPVGTPTHTSEGLTCDDDDHGSSSFHVSGKGVQINENTNDSRYQLKAGSRKHQHIVEVDPQGSGTKFGLVALDLPTDFHFGNDDGGKKEETQ